MELILSAIGNLIGNIIILGAVPFLWWLILHRKKCSFFEFVGLKKPKMQCKWWALLIFMVLWVIFYFGDFTFLLPKGTLEMLGESDSVAVNAYAGIGFAAIIPAFIENFIANGLLEELLFRGFINKRLCKKFGTVPGIIIQAVLFGLAHNALYIIAGVEINFAFHVFMFATAAVGALLFAFLDEKLYNGSILPSWFLHGIGNFIGTIRVAFGF